MLKVGLRYFCGSNRSHIRAFSLLKSRIDCWIENLEEVRTILKDKGEKELYTAPPWRSWFYKQCEQYHGNRDQYGEEKASKLESLNIVIPKPTQFWDWRFEELKSFWLAHGHTNVPTEGDKSLHDWVHNQREDYKRTSRLILTSDRIKKLEEIGFLFRPHEESWMDKFEELKEYNSLHGNCLVPTRDNAYKELGPWVSKQRCLYRHRQKGVANSLTDERIHLLNEIDFVWSAIDANWNEKYERLKMHIVKHGSVNEPPLSSDLVRWVLRQNAYFARRMQGGTVTTRMQESFEKLNALGVLFTGKTPFKFNAKPLLQKQDP
jgi:Helicase associated domain